MKAAFLEESPFTFLRNDSYQLLFLHIIPWSTLYSSGRISVEWIFLPYFDFQRHLVYPIWKACVDIWLANWALSRKYAFWKHWHGQRVTCGSLPTSRVSNRNWSCQSHQRVYCGIRWVSITLYSKSHSEGNWYIGLHWKTNTSGLFY